MNNSIFKQRLQRYIDGELDTIYEELPKMTMEPKRKHHRKEQHPPQEYVQQPHQEYVQQPPQEYVQQPPQEYVQQPPQQYRYVQEQYQEPMHPVYNPYDQEHRNKPEDIYGIEYLDKTNNDNAKKLSVELAEKILKTQTKVDYYKAMKKKASIKLEEHLKRKENDCEPLMQVMLSTPLDNVIHDGHKFTVVNGKNKKYIKITKLK